MVFAAISSKLRGIEKHLAKLLEKIQKIKNKQLEKSEEGKIELVQKYTINLESETIVEAVEIGRLIEQKQGCNPASSGVLSLTSLPALRSHVLPAPVS